MNDSYHNDTSRISNSMLSLLKQSPTLFYRRYILGQTSEPSDAMRLGSYLHAMVLEPETLTARFAIMPKVDRRTKEGKEQWSRFQEMNKGLEWVTQDQHDQAERLANVVLNHETFAQHADRIGKSVIEGRIDFTFNEYPCRCKPDMVDVESGVCWDLKTAKGASPKAFATSVVDYGYHRQAAFYHAALQQKYGKEFRFLFMVVETSEPYEAAIYELDEDAIEQGEAELSALLDEYRLRMASNDWTPEFSKGVNRLSLPKWYRSGIYQYEGAIDE